MFAKGAKAAVVVLEKGDCVPFVFVAVAEPLTPVLPNKCCVPTLFANDGKLAVVLSVEVDKVTRAVFESVAELTAVVFVDVAELTVVVLTKRAGCSVLLAVLRLPAVPPPMP
jgi:hypothetical protein